MIQRSAQELTLIVFTPPPRYDYGILLLDTSPTNFFLIVTSNRIDDAGMDPPRSSLPLIFSYISHSCAPFSWFAVEIFVSTRRQDISHMLRPLQCDPLFLVIRAKELNFDALKFEPLYNGIGIDHWIRFRARRLEYTRLGINKTIKVARSTEGVRIFVRASAC